MKYNSHAETIHDWLMKRTSRLNIAEESILLLVDSGGVIARGNPKYVI